MTQPDRPHLHDPLSWAAALQQHCSNCGARLVVAMAPGDDRERARCPRCGHVAYLNPRIVVGTVTTDDEGRVFLLRRGIEPGYGRWVCPGGFLEIDETAEEGAVRETLEEIGLWVETSELLGLYSRPEAGVVAAIYLARVVGGEPAPGVEALEVRAFAPEEIPWSEIAFRTSEWALRDWLARAVGPG